MLSLTLSKVFSFLFRHILSVNRWAQAAAQVEPVQANHAPLGVAPALLQGEVPFSWGAPLKDTASFQV